MSSKIRITPISLRIENMELGHLIRNLDNLKGHGVESIIPYSLNAYVDGRQVSFVLNYIGNKASVIMSSEDSLILDNLSGAVEQTLGTSK